MGLDEIAKSIADEFEFVIKSERPGELGKLLRKVENGTATYDELEKIASNSSQAIANKIKKHLPEIAPDGTITKEAAEALIPPALRNNYDFVSSVTEEVQRDINKSAGIGLNPVIPPFDEERAAGIAQYAAELDVEEFDKVADKIENFALSGVDAAAKANAAAHSKAGMEPKIKRIMVGTACKWCRSLAGTYDYSEVSGAENDVFRRHSNCHCKVLFVADGKIQDVHSKKLYDSEKSAKIEARTNYLKTTEKQRSIARSVIGEKVNDVEIKSTSMHVLDRIKGRGIDGDDIVDAVKNPLEITEIKTDKIGRRSFRAIGEKATVVINPDTGVVTTAHATHRKKAKKLKESKNK